MAVTAERVDRRVQRTRQLLRDALVALVLEEGYGAVTVQDIAERAQLSRATFYLHYRDKEELLLSSLEEMFDDLVQRIGLLSQERLQAEGYAPGAVAFRHAQANRGLYQIILGGEGGGAMIQRIREYLAQRIEEQVQREVEHGHKLPVPLEILSNYVAGSLMGLMTWWLENDLPYDADYMAQAFYQLHLPTLLWALTGEMRPAVGSDKPQ